MITSSANVRNSVWNIINIVLYPAAFLAATPFFINQLGDETFGVWMLMNSYVYISVHIVSYGLPLSITAHIAEAIGQDNTKKLHAYINVATRIMGLMAMAFALLSLVSWLLLPSDLPFFDENTWKIITVATALISVKFPELLYQSIFKGYERYDKAAMFNMTQRFLALSIQIALVIMGYGLLEIFIGNFLINIFVNILQAIWVYKGLHAYKFRLTGNSVEQKALFHFGFWTWLQTLIAVAAFQVDRFIVAYFLGTATVAYYVLASTIANHLHMAFEASVSWFFPKIARLKEISGDMRPYFHTIRAFSIGISLLAILVVFYLSDPMLLLWLGEEKYGKIDLFFKLFLIFESFFILSIVPKFYLNGIKSLQFITSLEFMFKSAIILSMVLFFAVFRTAESLIWGQITALLIFMPIEYYLVNKIVLHENAFTETILRMLPSLFVMLTILQTDWWMSAIYSLISIISFCLLYLKDKYFNLKLLLE